MLFGPWLFFSIVSFVCCIEEVTLLKQIDQLLLALLDGIFACHHVTSRYVKWYLTYCRIWSGSVKVTLVALCLKLVQIMPGLRSSSPISKFISYVRPISRKVILTSPLPLRPFSDMPSNEAFRAPQAVATNEGRLCTPTQSKTATPDQKTIPGEGGPDPLPAPAYFQLN